MSGFEVTLTWGAAAPVSSYVVEAGSATGLANLAQFDTGTTATSLTVNAPGGVYFVRVRARNGVSTGPPSNEVVVTVPGACASPAPPAGLSHGVSGATVQFTWAAVAAATRYVLEAGSGPGLANLASIDTGTAVATFTAAAPPGTYHVRVRARNACGTSAPSNETIVTIGGCTTPTAPGTLSASVSGSTVTLNWGPAGGSPAGYRVEVGSTTGAINVGQFDVGNTTSLTAAAPNGTYHIRVRAVSPCGVGAVSNEVVVSVFNAPTTEWLLRVNTWRQRAGVTPVVEEPAWSLGAALHSRYTVKTNANAYSLENPSSPWYTPEGAAIPLNSVAYWSRNVSDSDTQAIDGFVSTSDWLETVSLLDHRVRRVGFGSFREADPGGFTSMAAILDVKRGRDGPSTLAAPVVFPAPGAVIPGFEDPWCLDGAACSVHPYPGELATCGFSDFDMSVPIIMQFGTAAPPALTAASMTSDGVPIPVCAFTANTYQHQSASRKTAVTNSLTGVGGVVIFGRYALLPGRNYTVAATVNGQPYQWTFRVQ